MASLIIISSLVMLASTVTSASHPITCSDLISDNYDAMQAPSNETVQVAFQANVMNIAKVNVQDQVN